MCLFIFTNLGKCCDECGKSIVACCKSCNPLSFLLSLITCPIAMLVVMVVALPTAIFKWIPGTQFQLSRMCSEYCAVIKEGKAAMEGRSKKRSQLAQCCDGCLAELYCCCLPGFVGFCVFFPIFLIGWLFVDAIGYSFRGLCAGSIPRELTFSKWWPNVSRVVREYDKDTSMICYDDNTKGLVLHGCFAATDQQHVQLPNQQAAQQDQVAVNIGGAPQQQQYQAAPQPQVMQQNVPVTVPMGQPVAQPVAQPAYAPVAQPVAQPVVQQAYVPQQAATPGVPVARAVASNPPPAQQQPAAAGGSGLGALAGFGMSALNAASKAVDSAAAAVEKEAAKQRAQNKKNGGY